MTMRMTIANGLAALLLAGPATAAVQDTVTYEVRFPNAVHHEAEITVSYRNLPAGPLELRMSRSSPGRYAIHEFAKNVYNVRATDGAGREVALTRPDPYGWTATRHDGSLRVTYTLFADRADGTYSAIDLSHAHLSMPATFLWARGTGNRPIRITFHPPDGLNWRVATQLAPTGADFTFTAPDLAYFLDSPTELSDFELREWTVGTGQSAQTIRLAVHHTGTAAEVDAYADMARKVVAEQAGVFGEFPDFDYGTYTFIACYLPWAAGDGMEHRNSTTLTSTARIGTATLGTLSHEFFHAWSMERLRSAALEPFDFERANMSGELWFGEGFTSYYDDLAIHRAGLMTEADYLAGLSGMINTVVSSPGRRYHSVVEMSQRAPFVDAATSIDPTSFANTFISYYTWGSALGLGLDLVLRSRFNKSLDDLMRAMWRKYGRPEKHYTLDDIRVTLGEVAGDAAFADDFFRRYITGREVLDYAALLERAGVLLRKARPGQASAGPAQLQVRGGRLTFTGSTLVGSPWYEAGLDSGDEITSLDGSQVSSIDELNRIIAGHKPGDTLIVSFTQRGRQRTGSLVLIEDPRLEVVAFEQAGREPTAAMRRFRADWLASRAK